jgi:Amiloride-sensitive sodium channel
MSSTTAEAKVRDLRQTCVNMTNVSTKSSTSATKEASGWADFAGRSTCAAVTHLGNKSNPVPVKIIWRITLVVGIILTAVSTYFSTLSFMNMAGNSEMLLQTDTVNWFEHPKYHICTSSTFNLTILAGIGKSSSEYS